jgi:four helix bundle protein
VCASLHGGNAAASCNPTDCASYLPKANASLTKLKDYDILYLKDGDIVANDKLSEQSMDFAVQIINLVKQLKEQRENIISNQIGRSGTSIGANIREAKYAHGIADFISKMQISLKEANETGYWLELLYKTNYIGEEQYNFLESKCKSLRAMLVSSINTAKNNNK